MTNNILNLNTVNFKKITTILILTLFISYNSFSADVKTEKGPKFEFVGGSSYDWGKINKSDGPLKAKIQIKNTGNEDLKIHSVKPACGCTTAPISKDLIKPGETADLDVSLNISKQSGKVSKSINITTNDPKNDKVSYLLKCDVFVPLTLFPKALNFSNIEAGKEGVAKIILTNNTDKKIKILDVKNELSDIKLNIKSGTVLNPKENFAIEAKYLTKQPGSINSKVTIITDSEEAEMSFVVLGNISGNVSAPSGNK